MNENEPSFLGKERESILHFLGECLRPASAPQGTDAEMRDLLNQYLGARVVEAPEFTRAGTSVFRHIYQEAGSQTGPPVRKCLCEPGTPLPMLREIKEHHRRIAEASQSRAEQHAATAVYFGAIASALVLHHEKITSYADSDLQKAIRKLLDKSWMDADLKGLFAQGIQALEK